MLFRMKKKKNYAVRRRGMIVVRENDVLSDYFGKRFPTICPTVTSHILFLVGVGEREREDIGKKKKKNDK